MLIHGDNLSFWKNFFLASQLARGNWKYLSVYQKFLPLSKLLPFHHFSLGKDTTFQAVTPSLNINEQLSGE